MPLAQLPPCVLCRRGGGMHMGFDDPAFSGQVPLRGGFRGGGGVGGARWDPIAPPGMQVHPAAAAVQYHT